MCANVYVCMYICMYVRTYVCMYSKEMAVISRRCRLTMYVCICMLCKVKRDEMTLFDGVWVCMGVWVYV